MSFKQLIFSHGHTLINKKENKSVWDLPLLSSTQNII